MSSEGLAAPMVLRAWHEARGARFGPFLPSARYGTLEEPLDYGAPAREYDSARSGRALSDDSQAGRLELRGEDRHRFLNGLVTCDVAELAPGQGTYGFFTDPKGRVLADVQVLALEDRLWVRLPALTAETIAAHLEKYIVADRVEVSALDDLVLLTLLGPRAHELVPARLETDWAHEKMSLFGSEVQVVRDPGRGVAAYSLWVSASLAELVADELVAAGAEPVGRHVLETLRIEAGRPRFELDFSHDNLPQETALVEAVDYEKGCYLGQEIVARLHYRGQTAKELRFLRLEGEVPQPGTRLLLEEQDVGVITSATLSPRLQGPVALAMLKRRALELGTRLAREDGGVAEVSSPPGPE